MKPRADSAHDLEPVAVRQGGRRRKRRSGRAPTALSVLGLSILIPGAALAEGAVRILECAVARVCDAAGRCEAGDARVTFRMEPLDREPDGTATYTLSYADTRTEMLGLSDAGPFVWTIGNERHALLASSETEWLWHRLSLASAPEATIRFLSCSFQQ